jgi:hypothetical protein
LVPSDGVPALGTATALGAAFQSGQNQAAAADDAKGLPRPDRDGESR